VINTLAYFEVSASDLSLQNDYPQLDFVVVLTHLSEF